MEKMTPHQEKWIAVFRFPLKGVTNEKLVDIIRQCVDTNIPHTDFDGFQTDTTQIKEEDQKHGFLGFLIGDVDCIIPLIEKLENFLDEFHLFRLSKVRETRDEKGPSFTLSLPKGFPGFFGGFPFKGGEK
ncbi:MAG: hypothetical protein Q6362_003020 [Candidatus Wukongarchaeota archaeon]|nr:hypothetical protein [Candidatus Wukongarchaeota archaeon]